MTTSLILNNNYYNPNIKGNTMFKFRKTKDMLPSELGKYIADLENEITMQQKEIGTLKAPDTYAVDREQYFMSMENLLESMKIGDVRHVTNFKKFGETYKVKISPTRIDDYDTRIEAEHAAMLHNV